MIDTYLLEQLVAVRKYGTLIAAAETLNISQPTLSKSMKKLEDIMEIPLFIRSNRKIELNQTGKFFADRAAEFLLQGEALLDQVYSYDRNLHNISVGSCAPMVSCFQLLIFMIRLLSDSPKMLLRLSILPQLFRFLFQSRDRGPDICETLGDSKRIQITQTHFHCPPTCNTIIFPYPAWRFLLL